MMEILRKAADESRQRSKEMQKTIDEAGGWDNMVKKANQSPKAQFKQFMKEITK